MAKNTNEFLDTFVIYHSTGDGCWLGHSLKTDQIGCGDNPLEALAEIIRVVRIAAAEAQADPSLRLERFAPKEFWDLAKNAQPFPAGLVEAAKEMADGKLANWKIDVESRTCLPI